MAQPEIYVSVDIECDGPIPSTYSMLSLGAVAFRLDTPTWVETDHYYIELQPISESFVPEALLVSGLDRDYLYHTNHPKLAMADFTRWLGELGGRPVFVSFSTWDWAFVYWYLMTYTQASPFGHSSLDMKSAYFAKYGTTWRDTAKKAIKKARPQLLDGLGPHTHNALDDAREQGEFFWRMMCDQA